MRELTLKEMNLVTGRLITGRNDTMDGATVIGDGGFDGQDRGGSTINADAFRLRRPVRP